MQKDGPKKTWNNDAGMFIHLMAEIVFIKSLHEKTRIGQLHGYEPSYKNNVGEGVFFSN